MKKPKTSKIDTSDRPMDWTYVDIHKGWIPVRKGRFFCSPACGGRCTRANYQRAMKDADYLVKKLNGPEWKAEVWENLGWHFKASSGPLVVHGDRYTDNGSLRYTCSMLGITPDEFLASDPNKAVRHTVNHCIQGAATGLTELFQAAKAADMVSIFADVFCRPEGWLKRAEGERFTTATKGRSHAPA